MPLPEQPGSLAFRTLGATKRAGLVEKMRSVEWAAGAVVRPPGLVLVLEGEVQPTRSPVSPGTPPLLPLAAGDVFGSWSLFDDLSGPVEELGYRAISRVRAKVLEREQLDQAPEKPVSEWARGLATVELQQPRLQGLLRASKLLRHLKNRHRRDLLAGSRVVTIDEQGKVITKVGEPADTLWLLVSGAARILPEGAKVGDEPVDQAVLEHTVAHPEAPIGVRAWLAGTNHSMQVHARAGSELVAIERSHLELVLRRDRSLRRALAKIGTAPS